MTSVVDQTWWDSVYRAVPFRYDPDRVEFTELFERFLPTGGTCFEVGAYPGNFLVHLGRRFGYTVSGIDMTPGVEVLPEHLRSHGVTPGRFIRGDFFSYTPDERYDVVCSFGFIEHFANFGEVIRHHLPLLAPGGTLVLACPNFRGLQHLLHLVLDRQNLRRHYLPAMDLQAWADVLEPAGMRILHKGYYRTFDFWAQSEAASRISKGLARRVGRVARRMDRMVNVPNRLTSPHMVLFARAPG